MLQDQMDHIYRNMEPDNIPWNFKNPPRLLVDLLKNKAIAPCKAIEMGCGTGNYTIYLAGLGFQVTGVDFSGTAIHLAQNSAKLKGLDCRFLSADVVGSLSEITDTYDFVFDWELLHHIFPDTREKYLENVNRLLKPNGYYFSVFFSEDNPQFGGKGKYRKTPLDTQLYFSSETEMEKLYTPLFIIDELKTVDIAGKFGTHRAIYALLRKES